MRETLAQYRSFNRPARMLVVNQFTINVAFYMLMPYLAAHLSGTLGLAGWLVGLVLGVRNLSQQGMFLLGGALADRFGYKPLIVAGCTLRTGGFALLGLVDSLPALIIASFATGFAGALFNPAVRAYLAADAGERRIEAFALFNVFYQAGILVGPLVGLALTGLDFRLTCLVAAAVFLGLTIAQVRALPTHEAASADRVSSWRTVLKNRPFLVFSAAMIGSYVLSFQVYLLLPLHVRKVTGTELGGTVGVGALFAISAVVAIVGQVRITAWCKRNLPPGRCLVLGIGLMTSAFAVLLGASLLGLDGSPVALVPALLAAAVLTAGTMVGYPFEMDTIVSLADNRQVATHYGLYNTISGIGITVGNLLTGAALDIAEQVGAPYLPWLALVLAGAACTLAVHLLDRSHRLQPA
ncbi:MFS transporter [Allokutzneria sp. A3M-2-11 16]|uniref:MDR family MFS transporter n=1 Tax=Allokutzneria sp. A3M-2-11 16 TaxID=2962043 RepID=UPI0020B6E835|nr:MFS transporter [Allokutzneria sp. A3M-2-11 16]MCP3800759.1 MFS transporter [Allokutzneria sp. A3M-2-11 16]